MLGSGVRDDGHEARSADLRDLRVRELFRGARMISDMSDAQERVAHGKPASRGSRRWPGPSRRLPGATGGAPRRGARVAGPPRPLVVPRPGADVPRAPGSREARRRGSNRLQSAWRTAQFRAASPAGKRRHASKESLRTRWSEMNVWGPHARVMTHRRTRSWRSSIRRESSAELALAAPLSQASRQSEAAARQKVYAGVRVREEIWLEEWSRVSSLALSLVVNAPSSLAGRHFCGALDQSRTGRPRARNVSVG